MERTRGDSRAMPPHGAGFGAPQSAAPLSALSTPMEPRRLAQTLLWAPATLRALGKALTRQAAGLGRRAHGSSAVTLSPLACDGVLDGGTVHVALRSGVVATEASDLAYVLPPIVGPVTSDEHQGGDVPERRAVRNRLRAVCLEVTAELERRFDSGARRVELLSLGAASAMSTIEAAASFLERHPDARPRLVIVDDHEGALGRAGTLAQDCGLGSHTRLICRKPSELLGEWSGRRFDVVEAAGLLDLVPFGEAVRACRQIRGLLSPEGTLVTSQIGPSAWSFAMRWLFGWPTLYRRSPRYLPLIVGTAGFSGELVRLFVEPLGIHSIAVCHAL